MEKLINIESASDLLGIKKSTLSWKMRERAIFYNELVGAPAVVICKLTYFIKPFFNNA